MPESPDNLFDNFFLKDKRADVAAVLAVVLLARYQTSFVVKVGRAAGRALLYTPSCYADSAAETVISYRVTFPDYSCIERPALLATVFPHFHGCIMKIHVFHASIQQADVYCADDMEDCHYQ